MDLHLIFQKRYQEKLPSRPETGEVRGLDIWVIKSRRPEIRNEVLSADSLDAWLNEEGYFIQPDRMRTAHVLGRLRLLYHFWTPVTDDTQRRALPFSLRTWGRVCSALRLPPSLTPAIADGRQVSPITTLATQSSESEIGFVCQSPPLLDSFMTTGLTFDIRNRLTTGYLGFQSVKQRATSGVLLLESIRDAASQVHDPALIPALLFDVWVQVLQHEHSKIAQRIREVQEQTGLMSDYLRRRTTIESDSDYDSAHQTLVLQHAYLTNGIADFVEELSHTIPSCIEKIEERMKLLPNSTNNLGSDPQQQEVSHLPTATATSADTYSAFHVFQFIKHTQRRATAELQIRARTLSRINMYLQVLYNLMQQQISRDTKRDSSSMKSIALLTMVFLPATAIATVISPFIIIEEDDGSDRMRMAHHFWVFWAITAPVTVLVVMLWLIWIQRAEIARLIDRARKRQEQPSTAWLFGKIFRNDRGATVTPWTATDAKPE